VMSTTRRAEPLTARVMHVPSNRVKSHYKCQDNVHVSRLSVADNADNPCLVSEQSTVTSVNLQSSARLYVDAETPQTAANGDRKTKFYQRSSSEFETVYCLNSFHTVLGNLMLRNGTSNKCSLNIIAPCTPELLKQPKASF